MKRLICVFCNSGPLVLDDLTAGDIVVKDMSGNGVGICLVSGGSYACYKSLCFQSCWRMCRGLERMQLLMPAIWLYNSNLYFKGCKFVKSRAIIFETPENDCNLDFPFLYDGLGHAPAFVFLCIKIPAGKLQSTCLLQKGIKSFAIKGLSVNYMHARRACINVQDFSSELEVINVVSGDEANLPTTCIMYAKWNALIDDGGMAECKWLDQNTYRTVRFLGLLCWCYTAKESVS